MFYPNRLPKGFPAKFACVSSTVKPTVILNSTDLNFNVTEYDSLGIDCDNSVASDKSFCAMGILKVNIMFAILVFLELCYLVARAIISKQFTFDYEFCQKYFFNKCKR